VTMVIRASNTIVYFLSICRAARLRYDRIRIRRVFMSNTTYIDRS
jgi:hypothetical protein